MHLTQPLKLRRLKTGCFKMPHLQTPRLQMAVFQTRITVASGPCRSLLLPFARPVQRKTQKTIQTQVGKLTKFQANKKIET